MIQQIREQHPEETHEQHLARLAYREKHLAKKHRWKLNVDPVWIAILLLLLLLLLLAKASHAQTPVNVDRVGGTKVDYSLGMPVFCVSGCSGGGGGGAITDPLDLSGNVKVAVQNATIAVTQSTSPWVVSGTVTANQGTSPWVTQETGSGTVLSGQQAVTGTAAALATNSAKKACVKALSANTINIYVGPSGITTSTGFELTPGSAVCMPVSNTNLLYVVASTTGANAAWLATN